jgi:hypothetical protein
MQTPAWHWAEPRSVWLLDYWKAFEPKLRFILLYTSPQQAIARALAANTDLCDPATLLAQWESATKAMLRFHLRNPERSLMIDSGDALRNPGALADACTLSDAERTLLPISHPVPPLALYLAHEVLTSAPHLKELHSEVCASIAPAVAGSQTEHPAEFTRRVGQAIEDYVETARAAARAAPLQAQAEALAERIEMLDNTLAEQADALLASEQAQAGLRELLSQGEQRWEADANTIDSLKATIEQLETNLRNRDTALEGAVRRFHDAEEQVELLLKELHEAQEERESRQFDNEMRGVAHELEKQIAALTDIVAERDEQLQQAEVRLKEVAAELRKRDSNARARLEAALSAQQAEAAAASKAAAEAHEEAEVLLHQLQQAQEELEEYFLKHCADAQRIDTLEARWQRMLEKNPGYWEYAQVELLDSTDPAHRTTWLFHGLAAGGQCFDELKVVLDTGNKTRGLEIERAGEAVSLRDLAALSTSDWQLLPALVDALSVALTETAEGIELSDTDRTNMQAALEELTAALQDQPATLRFDAVQLKHEQVNPDYEHLWFAIHNLSFDCICLDQFEFRLGCGNIGPRRFGTHPKLEFPQEAGANLFDQWFAESSDDFGDKLELRFALPDGMDVGVWHRLSTEDQTVLRSLIDRLPAFLATLKDTKLHRPLADWEAMAQAMHRIYGACAPQLDGVGHDA